MIDKSRIAAEHSLEANYLKFQCELNETVDEIAVKVIQNDTPDFLLPIRTLKKNGSVELRYTIGTQTALKYKDMTFHKKQFLLLYQSLLKPFIEGSDWMLDYHCYCIDSNYVFIDKNGKDALYMYFPVDTCKNTDAEIIDFFKDIINRVTVEDDSAFLLKLFQYFSRGNVTISELYQMVEQELHSAKNVRPDQSVDRAVAPKPITPQVQAEKVPVSRIQEQQSHKSQSFPSTPIQAQNVEQEQQNPAAKSAVSGLFGGKQGSEETKKNSFFGNFGKKNDNQVDFHAMNQDVSASVVASDTSAQDEVMNALFGTSNPKDKKKEKKLDKKIDKKKEKSGGFFGGKKKTAGVENSLVQATPISEAEQQKPVIPQVKSVAADRSIQNYEYTQIDSDQDVTQIEDVMVESCSQYLQSMNNGIPGVPDRISLDFLKERITIGRQSGDVRQPDIIFSAENKRVGRMHACIQKENRNIYVFDLVSANSTVIKGGKVVRNQPYLLKSDDVIGLVAAHPITYKVVL